MRILSRHNITDEVVLEKGDVLEIIWNITFDTMGHLQVIVDEAYKVKDVEGQVDLHIEVVPLDRHANWRTLT